MGDHLIVQTTFSNEQDALDMAQSITRERLTACTQIDGPIKSVYWWKDDLETDEEWRCTFKTTKRLYPKLEERIKKLHPYETPEIVAFAILDGSRDYLQWIDEEVIKG